MTPTQVDATLASRILPFLNLTHTVVNDASLIEGILALCSGSRQEPIAVQAGSPLAQLLDAFIPTRPNANRSVRAANRNRAPCPPCSRKHQGVSLSLSGIIVLILMSSKCIIISDAGQPRLCLKCKERGLLLCPPKVDPIRHAIVVLISKYSSSRRRT